MFYLSVSRFQKQTFILTIAQFGGNFLQPEHILGKTSPRWRGGRNPPYKKAFQTRNKLWKGKRVQV